jgi:vancomycin resistance protein VanJ
MAPDSAATSSNSLLDRFASALQRRKEPGSCLGRILRLVSLAHLAAQLAVLLGVAGLLLGMSVLGERNLFTAFCLFLPTHIWALPLLVAFPIALLTPRRWICVPQLLLAAYLLGPYMGWRMDHPARGPVGGTTHLTVLTNNRGQKGGESMVDFIRDSNPDLMLFQEAGNRADNYLRGYPQFSFAKSDAEFTLVSKYPILDSNSLRLDQDARGEGGQITANRAVIDVNGRQVAIYNVHMPTPRGALRSLRGPALLHGLLDWPGTPWRKNGEAHMSYWRRKERLTKELSAILEKEKLPYLVAGDFNMPHQGYLHRLFAKTGGGLTDAHANAGKGYGFTLPGSTNNPVTLGNPWLRLDYVFASRHWKVHKCVTEKDRPSQHRAVVAVVALENDNK